MIVRGVDGCRGGWITVSAGGDGVLTARVFANAELLLQDQDYTLTTIDIPIGLPANGPRACDTEARKIVGARRNSVFPAPVRSVLAADTYEAACVLSERAAGKKLSKQAFALLPKVREVDEYLRSDPAAVSRVLEVHPEVCFAYWNGGTPMGYPKLSGFGFVERFKLADQQYPGAAERIRREFAAPAVGDDDILDALAALWTATRIASGSGVRIGPEDARDEFGLPMNMWA